VTTPTHLSGADAGAEGARAAALEADPLTALSAEDLAVFNAIAEHLIPAAHGMPSAAEVVTEQRLRFVLRARPDLLDQFVAALRAEPGADPSADPQARLDALAESDPGALAALQLVLVGGYYTDRNVRRLIGYPGQMAIEVRSWEVPPYIEEGLVDAALARGPVWRDPSTGERAVDEGAPRTYADRYGSSEDPAARTEPEGGHDGRNLS
jgi:hypothetical protein